MNSNLRKWTQNDDAVAADVVPTAGGTPTYVGVFPAAKTPASSQSKKAKKYPCGKCSKEVTASVRSLRCQVCEFWFHADCVSGRTKEYFENCTLTYTLIGRTSFLCNVYQCVVSKFKNTIKEMQDTVAMLSDRVTLLETEKEILAR